MNTTFFLQSFVTLGVEMALLTSLPQNLFGQVIYSYEASRNTLPRDQGFTLNQSGQFTDFHPQVIVNQLLVQRATNAVPKKAATEYWATAAKDFFFSSGKFVLEIRIRMMSSRENGRFPDSLGYSVEIIDSAQRLVGFSLSTDTVATYSGPRLAFNTTDALHTYRLVVSGDSTSLFIDNIFYGRSPVASPDVNLHSGQLAFGDLGSVAESESELASVKFAKQRMLDRPAIETAQVRVCWPSVVGMSYVVEYQSELVPGVWLPLMGNAVVATQSESCVLDDVPSGAPRRFYRVLERQ